MFPKRASPQGKCEKEEKMHLVKMKEEEVKVGHDTFFKSNI